MEQDRAETNLGLSVDPETAVPVGEKPKQPKKRFVGRRSAEAGKANVVNGAIEDSSAIQGI